MKRRTFACAAPGAPKSLMPHTSVGASSKATTFPLNDTSALCFSSVGPEAADQVIHAHVDAHVDTCNISTVQSTPPDQKIYKAHKPSMLTLLSLELFKLKRQCLILAVVLVIAIEFLLLRFSIVRSLTPESDGRMVLFDLSFYNTMFLPILCTVIASIIVDVERSGHMLANLLTMVEKSRLFWVKEVISILVLTCIILVHTAGAYIIAHHYFATYSFTLPTLVFYACSTLIISILILLIVQVVALVSKSQFVANITGAVLTLLGLFGILLPYRVMIVDDQMEVRCGLTLILNRDARLCVAYEAENGQRALEKLKAHASWITHCLTWC